MPNNTANALTFEALVSLTRALEAADSPADFLAAADNITGQTENILPLPFETGEREALDPGVKRQKSRDSDNAPAVYEFLGALDRSNASDRRLWTFLAFVTYREYMEKRWPLAEAKNWKGRVRDRWLLLNVSRGSLIRHGIARLWWVSALTYDPQCEYNLSKTTGDSFAYTKEVFRKEDRLNSLFDREAGTIPSLVRALLEHAAQDDAYSKDKYLGAIMMEATLVYGYRDLSMLTDEELQELVTQAVPISVAV